MNSTLPHRIQAAANVIRNRLKFKPDVAIILGTGLSGLAGEIHKPAVIPYAEIPEFPQCTVKSHCGELVMGKLEGRNVAALSGRFHFDEGWSMEDLRLPVRVMRELGAQTLIVSGASGCMNPQFHLGDIVLLEDHINLMGTNPLIGPNDDSLGPRYPDMSWPYDRELLKMAEESASAAGVRARPGVYAAMTGPSLETRAEYRFLRTIGADVVGMSVVPEVIVAVHAGMRVLGLAVVTDMCLPDAMSPVDVEAVLATARAAEPKMTAIVKRVLGRLGGPGGADGV